MPFFKYVAKNEHNETVKGKVEAKNKNLAASILTSRGLLVIEIKSFDESSLVALKSSLFGIKDNDVVNLTRQLSTMITAGLPLNTCLSILAEQSRPEVSVLVSDLLREIEGGSTLSEALSQKPKVFSRVYTQLIKAGETAGVLDEILARLATTMEKQKEFRGKTRGALIYPAIVLAAMLIVGFVMMIFVIPKLTQMYDDFGAQLPVATQILIDISNFFVNFWWLIIALIVGGIMLLTNWRKTELGDKTIDRLLFKLPVFGDLRKKVILTEMARTLSLLLGAGVSLIESLQIVGEGINSINYRLVLREVSSRIEKGISLSQSLGLHDIFPPIFYQMAAVGEETGKLDEVLLRLSTYFETESEQAVKNLTTALEPIIMIVLGLGVGLMVVAIIMPIYSLTSQF